jgi:capsular polysaccharide export protein
MQQSKASVWTASLGISNNPQLRSFFLDASIKKVKPWSQPNSSSLVVGWGNKPNTLKAQTFATKYDLPYVRLEDGFIGYLGHPSSDKNRLSLIQDDVGIYYDARQSSRLENLCLSIKSKGVDHARVEALVDTITSVGITKYNHSRCALPDWLVALGECVLLIDQTAGDQSIECGLASAASFQEMLQAALTAHPNKPIAIKTHPDVLIAGKGGKRGHFSADQLPSNVYLLTDDCSVAALMGCVRDVYVATSQMGFEALLYGKRVHCFGMPFYAGWGLTEDRLVCERRNVSLSLAELVCATLIEYPTYLHPESQTLCDVEDVVDWLILQLEAEVVEVCYAFGFSLWKRAFVKQFVGRLAASIVFINNAERLEALLKSADSSKKTSILLWGRGRSTWADVLRQYADVWFMEDGFLRSVGLGADLRRPSCLVIDRQGMYYDSSDKSDVIDILNSMNLSPSQIERALSLIALIQQQSITKYNVGCQKDSALLLAELRSQAGEHEIIIVPGQFENDLSIACSLGEIKTNIALLAQVRADYPAAFIIFKEHPDVYSGVRAGALGEQAAQSFADLYLADIDMASLLACADRVCTLTSLTGFEALLRNKAVTVYGSPFYAGWGLTEDKISLPDRNRPLVLAELVYGAMIEYSRYVDWSTGYLTGPEQTVAFLAHQREGSSDEALKSSWLARQGRKLKYFIDTYFF